MVDPLIGSVLNIGKEGIAKLVEYYQKTKKKKEFREKFNDNVLDEIMLAVYKESGKDAINAIRMAALSDLPMNERSEFIRERKTEATVNTYLHPPPVVGDLVRLFKEFKQYDAINNIFMKCTEILARERGVL